VVPLMPIQATAFSRVGVFAGRDHEPLPVQALRRFMVPATVGQRSEHVSGCSRVASC
jgi:hypothetical protein